MMFTKNRKLHPIGICTLLIFLAQAVHSAPGELSDKPLFLGTTVQPNILFVVDDSGSMDWEVLKSTGAQLAYSDLDDYPNEGNIDITPTRNDSDEMLESCAGYNVMYYDPNIVYTPWAGLDKNLQPYQNQSITSARRNPYDPDEGTTDLTDDEGYGDPPGYFVWNDSDNDGEFDIGECPDPNLSGFNYNASFIATTSGYGPAEMSDTEKTNFANWFSYYRKREYVAKKALSEIINDSTARVGLATLHNNGSVGTEIKDIDNISNPSGTASVNKQTLLDNLFSIYSQHGTPLRKVLKEAGRYFEVGQTPSNDLFGFTPSPTTPILSEANGGACQQNFTVMMSDGYWNGSAPSGISNNDGDGDSNFDGGSYADTYEDTLADVAMHFYERDLAPALDNVVPVTAGVDENTAQHMVSYMVAFGITGTLDANPSDRDEAFTWPAPWASGNSDSSPEKIDDMRHAAWNGRGEFLNAKDSQELIDSLSESIASIQNRTGSASAVAFNTTSVTVNTYVYQARFDSANWSGTLQAFQFDDDGVGTPVWDAGELLEDDDDWDDRNIFTFRTDTNTGIPFEWPSNYHTRLTTNPDDSSLSRDQIVDLLINAPYDMETTDSDEQAANAEFGEAIVNFIKGDQTNEGGGTWSFRDRQGKRLGDIIHSSPEYVGVPSEPYPNRIEGDLNLYSDFRVANENRRDIVYVGANDGMLHAFDADTGREVFAYIPGQLFGYGDGGIHKLSEHDYSHIAYVDGSVISRDVFVNGSWKTYVVGGYRAGGKGIYVLDVTDPSRYTSVDANRAEDLAVMEFSHDDMGYSFSKPQIGRMNNGKWAAIFGNGYNSDPSGDGTAKLFILYLDGSGFEALETNTGSIASSDCSDLSSDCNGMSSPSIVDINGDFKVDRIYAGDLHGNMWVFDVSDSSSTNWGSAFETSTSTPAPLFTACSTDPCTRLTRQPITSKPTAVGHPTISSAATFPNVLVLFGTGQYIAESDNTDVRGQSFYGVWDAGNEYDEYTRANLTEQVISVPLNEGNVNGGRVLTNNTVSYNASNSLMGWYIDLPTAGERVVVDAVVASDLVFFNTTIPETAQCSAGGSGYLMAAQIRTGGQPGDQVFTRFDDGAQSVEIVGEYSGIPLDAVPGGGTIINGDTIVISDSLGRVVTTEFSPGNRNKNSRRASWSVVK